MIQLQGELERLRETNSEVQAKLEAATDCADKGAEDIERLKAELATREDEIERVRLELDELRNRSSVLGDMTPRSDGHFSEPPSYVPLALANSDWSRLHNLCRSPTMHIGSVLRHNQHDVLSQSTGTTLLGPHMDDVDEFDDPFRPPYVRTSTNSFLESVQHHHPGNIETLTQFSEQLATPVSCSVYPLPRSESTLVCTRSLETPEILADLARR